MGNSVRLQVCSEPDGTVLAECEIQYVLPFLWLGFVPPQAWDEHGARLTAALRSGRALDADAAEVRVPWSVALPSYRDRLGAVERTWPELADAARAFLGDVASVAARPVDAVLCLDLLELVVMSVADEHDVDDHVAEVVGDASLWDSPDRRATTRVSELERAVAEAEPERSFLLGGEWTAGGNALPRQAPPALAERVADRVADVGPTEVGGIGPERPEVPRPSWITPEQWRRRYDPRGDDLWERAATDAASRRARAADRAAPWTWWRTVVTAITAAVVVFVLAGAATQDTVVAAVAGALAAAVVVIVRLVVVRLSART